MLSTRRSRPKTGTRASSRSRTFPTCSSACRTISTGRSIWGMRPSTRRTRHSPGPGGCDWDDHNDYNNNYGGGGGGGGNNNVNVNKNVDRSRTKVEGGGRQKWQHNPEHRGGVGYRDQASAKKYGGRDRVAARDRANQDVSRGYGRGQEGGGRPSQQPAGGRSPQQGGSRPGTGPGQGGGGRQASAGEPGGRGGQRPGG